LFITFEFSSGFHPEFAGRTDVKITGPYIDINGKYIWEQNSKLFE